MQTTRPVIGIVGMAKNTGKTTTAIKIMEMAYDEETSLGLTSIGYDGEEIDNVTCLPKPRYYVRIGTIVATARRCMHAGSASLKVLAKTNIHTALGEVIIGKVKKAGTVLVAGPNTSKALNFVINEFKGLGCELILVDGAINRVAPMTVVDGLILTTGAAHEIRIEKLAYETRYISKIFSLPVVDPKLEMRIKDRRLATLEKNEQKKNPFDSSLTPATIEKVMKELYDEKLVVIEGIIEASALLKLAKRLGRKAKDTTISFRDPTKLLVSGSPKDIFEALTMIENFGGKACYLHPIPLIAITINPFYPKYSNFYQSYEPAYVDRSKLLSMVSQSTHVPVIDVMSQNGGILLKIVHSTLLRNFTR